MQNQIKITTDKANLNIEMIHNFLSKSYWAFGRTIEEVRHSIEHSYCFGIFIGDKQIGFARVVSDFTIFAYLMDVFILEEFRGNGYSKLLLDNIFGDEKLKSVKKWLLATKDAHSLYNKFGFESITNVDRWMEKICSRI